MLWQHHLWRADLKPALDERVLFTGWIHQGWVTHPVNMRRSPNVDLMLAHRLRRWPNIKSTLGKRFVFAGQAIRLANTRR